MSTPLRICNLCLQFAVTYWIILSQQSIRADTWNWDPDPGSGSDLWSEANNWDAPNPQAPTPPVNDGTADITFFLSQAMGNSSHVDTAWAVHSLSFSSNMGRDLYGEQLTIGDGGINVQSNPGNFTQSIIIQNDIKLSASQSWIVGTSFSSFGSIDTNGFILSISTGPSNAMGAPSSISFTGAITGTGSLSFLGPGGGGNAVQLNGNQDNTYTGLSSVQYGLLELAKSGGAVAIPGNLTIGTGADPSPVSGQVRLLGEGQISNTSNLTVQRDGTFDLNGHSSSVATLAGSGVVTNNGSSESILYMNAGASVTSDFAGTLTDGSGTLRVDHNGAGTVLLSGNNTNSEVEVNGGGTLRVTGTNTAYLTVSNGRLEGTGSTSATLEAGPNNNTTVGTLAPGGEAIGALSAGALWIAQNGVLEIQLNTDNHTNDQILLTGGTNAFGHGADITPGINGGRGGALTLRDLGSAILPVGDTFTIVRQMGSAETFGNFDGLPEGATITAGNNSYEIHYHGGLSLEDIFLEVITPIPEPSTWGAAALALIAIGHSLSINWRRARQKRAIID